MIGAERGRPEPTESGWEHFVIIAIISLLKIMRWVLARFGRQCDYSTWSYFHGPLSLSISLGSSLSLTWPLSLSLSLFFLEAQLCFLCGSLRSDAWLGL